jgi:TolB protein
MSFRTFLSVATWTLSCFLAFASQAQDDSELSIIINKGGTQSAISVAVVPFGWKGVGRPPENLAQIVASDLRRSGRFSPLTADALPARPTSDSQIDFARWRPRASYLVVGNVIAGLTPNTYQVQFRLFDVLKPDATRGLAGTQLIGLNFQRKNNQLRTTAHDIADQIYEAIIGEPGAFNSRIAYITETGRGTAKKQYALKIADSDGHNAFSILESPQPIMSPAWSPDGGRLAYVSFEGRRARIYIQDLASGKRTEVAAHRGVNGAPAFSPDGTRLAMTLSKDGNTEVYVLHLRTKKLRRLTNNAAIDTEPAWTPDGRGVVFTSNRGGGPQIYWVSANGGAAKRLTFDGGYNAGASFSPDGRNIAVVHQTDAGHQIGVYDLERKRVKVLTKTGRDDSPTFSPNGAMVLYSTVDIEGSTLTAVTVVGGFSQSFALRAGIVRDPAWGPTR